ncbi:hypothetical protein [Paenibacillus sp. DYY-L-2]|uniref:hypothetical protein n=1 Tax=Paenibacillus sp. DYY-L-2 TaxID=3447013 RepID=UPI003F4FBF11
MPNRLSKPNRTRVIVLSAFLCLVLFIAGTTPAQASDSGWGEEEIANIEQLYDSSDSLESVNTQVKQQIQSLRKQNNEKLKSIQAQIRLIDKTKLDQLKLLSDQTQKKYAPLLAEYTELGKKAAEARKRKDKKAALIFDLKRNRIKASVTLARQEIKSKKDALAAAKSQASAKAKPAKEALKEVTPLKQQITAENKRVSASNKAKSAAQQRYKEAVKKGDATAVAEELGGIVGTLSEIQASQKRICAWEQSIANILKSAEAKLP